MVLLKDKKNICIVIVFFFLILSLLIFSSPFYIPVKLYIYGSGVPRNSELLMQWDSGYGLNQYETEKVVVGAVQPDQFNLFHVVIRKLEKKNSIAAGSRVICNGIWVDDKLYPVQHLISAENISLDKKLLEVTSTQSALEFSLNARSHIRIEFLTFNFGGKVEVQVNDWRQTYDLYTPNDLSKWGRENIKTIDLWPLSSDASFIVSMDLRRYSISSLQVKANDFTPFFLSGVDLSIKGQDKTSLAIDSDETGCSYSIILPDELRKKYFHPVRFFQQLIYTFLLTWIAVRFWLFISSFGNIKNIVVEQEGYVFLLFLVPSLVIGFLWQLAFWPAVMSVDSLKVWRAAQIPGLFLADHPVMNVIFYNFLSMFWNNIAVVPLVQIIATSCLTAAIFHYCYRHSVPVIALVLLYLCIIFSVPICLYNIILWKDIPFALLILLLAFIFVVLFKSGRDGKHKLSRLHWTFIFLITCCLPLIRYNGIIYLVLVPFYLLLLKFIKVKRKTIISVVSGVVFIFIVCFSFTPISSFMKTKVYLVSQGFAYLQRMNLSLSSHFFSEKTQDYFTIFNVNQNKTQWDLWHYYLHDRYNYSFLKRVRWSDVYRYIPEKPIYKPLHDLGMKIYGKSYKKPWVYFTWNPFYLLILLPIMVLLWKWFPVSALFSGFILAQVLTLLVIVQVLNWRYYYFAYIGILYLLPLIGIDMTDIYSSRLKKKNAF